MSELYRLTIGKSNKKLNFISTLELFRRKTSFKSVRLRLSCKIFQSVEKLLNQMEYMTLVVNSQKEYFGNTELNDVLKRACSTIHVPIKLEHLGLSRDDGESYSLTCVATYINTLALYYIKKTSVKTGYAVLLN